MSARRVLTEGQQCEAAELHGGYIGQMIRFNWYFPHSRVLAVITGELRQIYHIADKVSVNLIGHAGDEGTDLTEFELDRGEPIVFLVVK